MPRVVRADGLCILVEPDARARRRHLAHAHHRTGRAARRVEGGGAAFGGHLYYLASRKVTFHVSVSRDHGYPAYMAYSGWDEMQMKEIAYTLRDAGGLRYDEG